MDVTQLLHHLGQSGGEPLHLAFEPLQCSSLLLPSSSSLELALVARAARPWSKEPGEGRMPAWGR